MVLEGLAGTVVVDEFSSMFAYSKQRMAAVLLRMLAAELLNKGDCLNVGEMAEIPNGCGDRIVKDAVLPLSGTET